jgi:hypothetical protein
MPQMDFFRRPILAGRNLKRLLNGTIRGSFRRSDADINSSVPYFPGASNGQTLTIVTEAGTYTATITSNSLAQIISDINAALTSHGFAFDADGSLAISTTGIGGAGFVQVIGGTAASFLGFNLSLGRAIRSSGGDIESAPEGRVGNPFGTAFPGRGDNLSMSSFQRAFGRLSANQDVIYSDMVREEPITQKIGNVNADATGAYVTVPGTTRVFNGLGVLNRLSTANEIAPYFFLLDPTTKQVLPNKVVGMVLGVPVGSPPYTDATDVSTASRNLFGRNLSKFGPIAITSITEGRLVNCTGCGTGTYAGDVAQISSATNTDQWSNNGMKWIVETVVDANNIVLRPASQAELTMLGITLNDTQPVVELNGDISGGQSYGTLAIYLGAYVQGASLVVSPSLSNAQTVELWGAQPGSLRQRSSGVLQRSLIAEVSQSIRKSFSDTIVPFAVQRNSAGTTGHLFDVLDEIGSALSGFGSGGDLFFSRNAAQSLSKTGGSFSVGTGDANATILKTNNVNRVQVDASGNLQLLSGSTGAIQSSGAMSLVTTSPNDIAVQLNSAAVARWRQSDSALLLEATGVQSILKGNQNLQIGTSGAFDLAVLLNNAAAWTFQQSSGNLVGNAAGAQSISKSSGALNLSSAAAAVWDTAGSLTIGTRDANSLILKANNTSMWQVTSAGAFAAVGGNRQISNVLDPSAAQDAATKNYIDVTLLQRANSWTTTQTLSALATNTIDSNGASSLSIGGTSATGLALGRSGQVVNIVGSPQVGGVGVNLFPAGGATVFDTGAPYTINGLADLPTSGPGVVPASGRSWAGMLTTGSGFTANGGGNSINTSTSGATAYFVVTYSVKMSSTADCTIWISLDNSTSFPFPCRSSPTFLSWDATITQVISGVSPTFAPRFWTDTPSIKLQIVASILSAVRVG